MNAPLLLLVALQSFVADRVRGDERERGDVPGWVLITLMTAGIVAVIWGFAEDRLKEILEGALESVTPA